MIEKYPSREEIQPHERQELLDVFAERPEDAAVWHTAYDWVRAEGDAPGEGVAGDIPAEELIAMAETVRATDPGKRYDVMATTASNGKIWFDVIEGFSSDSTRQILQDTVTMGVQQRGAPFWSAVDIGTGVGKTLSVLEQNADEIIGVDRNAALLAVAKQRAGVNTSLVQADITRLPFPDASFDLASSIGIESSLDKATQIAFFTELARVLMPGGTYITAFTNYPHMPSEYMSQITETSKAMLSDMICDTVSGGATITERLEDSETERLLAELGLHRAFYLDAVEDPNNRVVLQVITK